MDEWRPERLERLSLLRLRLKSKGGKAKLHRHIHDADCGGLKSWLQVHSKRLIAMLFSSSLPGAMKLIGQARGALRDVGLDVQDHASWNELVNSAGPDGTARGMPSVASSACIFAGGHWIRTPLNEDAAVQAGSEGFARMAWRFSRARGLKARLGATLCGPALISAWQDVKRRCPDNKSVHPCWLELQGLGNHLNLSRWLEC